MLDVTKLDRYIVIRAEGQPELAAVSDLRELEGDFGAGVSPLWSDELQSIVAWAFAKSQFEQAEAEEWLKQATAKPEGMSVVDLIAATARAVVEALADALGLRAIAAKREGDWFISPVRDLSLADEKMAWSWDTAASNAVLGDDNWERFASAHLLVDMSGVEEGEDWPTNKTAYKLPVAKMIGDSLRYVWKGAAAANAALSGARTELKAPDAAKQSAVTTLKGIYKKFDKDPDQVSAQADAGDSQADEKPIRLIALTTQLGSGEEAEPDEDDGLIWKEIIHPGSWFKSDTGSVLEITADIIRSVYDAFKAGLPKFVSVPAGSYHPDVVPAEANRGFVKKLKLIGERLFGGFDFTNPETKQAVEDGSIADCSIYIIPEVFHPSTGELFDWVLSHVLLTNIPLVQDLDPFGAPLPASAGDRERQVEVYVQEVNMSEETQEALSAADRELLERVTELGLSSTDIQTMLAERESVAAQARDLEITRIVRALEGQDEHASVTQVENTRHWPVVIAAVETALREQPQALGLSVQDGATSLDEVILAVVNAIPADARMQLQEQPAGASQHVDPTLEDDDSVEVKDAKAKALAEYLTPRRGAAVSVG